MNNQPLLPYTLHLLRIKDLNLLNQLIEHLLSKFLCTSILPDSWNKHIGSNRLTCKLFELGFKLFESFGQFFLFFLILDGHPRKTLITNLAWYIVLIDALKECIKLFVTGLKSIYFFLHRLTFTLSCFLRMPHDSFGKPPLILACKLRKAMYLSKNNLFQKINPDIMRRIASPTVAFVVGTIKVFYLRITLIEVIVQIVSTVGTDKKSRKHIHITVICFALSLLSSLLLNLFPYWTLNDRSMYIAEYNPILTVILYAFFELVWLRVSLEVKNVPAILLKRKYLNYRRAVPMCRRQLFSFSGTVYALACPICSWSQYSILLKCRSYLFAAVALNGHSIDSAYNLCCFLIYNPMLGIVRVFYVTVRRLSHGFSWIALNLVADSALLADVTSIPFVKHILDGSKLVFTFGSIYAVGNGNQTNIVSREEFFHKSADFYVVTS